MTELSRRALFGAGLTRLARARVGALATAPPQPRPRPAAGAAAPAPDLAFALDHHLRLVMRSASAADVLIDALGIEPGERVLDVTAGSGGPLAPAVARRGAHVTTVDATSELATALPFNDDSVDCVASAFGLIHGPDVRGATRELVRVLRPGGRIGLATWSAAGAMGHVLRAARKGGRTAGRRSRPERWGTYEGLQLALEAFPGFEVTEHALSWRYPDREALWRDFIEPPELRDRLAPFVDEVDGEIVLRVEWCLALGTAVL